MKFITEDDLRTCYRKEPFTSYQLENGAKLTPGARQFLQDRGILMFEGSKTSVSNNKITPQKDIIAKEANCDATKKKFLIKVKFVELKFLQAANTLIKTDVSASENIINLRRRLSQVKEAAIKEDVNFEGGIISKESVNWDKSQELDITEFHLQLEKGEQILLLGELKLLLEELLLDISSYFGGDGAERNKCSKVSVIIEQIINELATMIFAAYGGNLCQRK